MSNLSRAPLEPDWRRMESCWPSPPKSASLGNDEVHVWLAFLRRLLPRIDSFLPLLSADEIERAGRFHIQKHRNDYILARGLLRKVLNRYTGIPPGQVRFCYNAYGKPAMVSECGGQFSFNVSHANGAALYAVTMGRRVGVDLEYMRGNLDHEQIAELFFSPRETALLRQLPPRLRQEAFFACWTRKEAYIKARGYGASLDLRSFDVAFVPGHPAALLRTETNPVEASRWSLLELAVPPGYVAALAVEGNVPELKCWQVVE